MLSAQRDLQCCTLPYNSRSHLPPPFTKPRALTGAALCLIAGPPAAKKARSETNGRDHGLGHGQDHGKDHGPDHGQDHGPDHEADHEREQERRYPSEGGVAGSLDLRSPATLSLTQPPARPSSSEDDVS